MLYLPYSEKSPNETEDPIFSNSLRDTFPGFPKQPAMFICIFDKF